MGLAEKLSRMNVKNWNFQDCLFGKLINKMILLLEEIFETQGKQGCSTKLMDGSFNILQTVISSNVVLIFIVRIYGISVKMIKITMIFR